MISWSIGLCCVLGTVAFAAEAGNSRSAYFISRNNKRLEGKTVRTIDSPSLLSCSQTCLEHLWCTSTNFQESFGKTSKGNCELNMHEFSPFNDETQLTDKAGSTFALVLKVKQRSLLEIIGRINDPV